MTAIFLTGPLACPSVLQRVLGDGVQPAPVAASLCDMHTRTVPGNCFALWGTPDEGAQEGQLLIPDATAQARIDFFAEAVGLSRQTVTVQTEQGDRDAWVYLSSGDAPPDAGNWSLADWAKTWEATAVLATAEIMSCQGRIAATDLSTRMQMILARAGAQVAAQDSAPATLRSTMQRAEVEEVACTVKHAGYFITNEYSLRHPQYDGTRSPQVTREVFICTDASIVLPYDPVRDRVCLIEQFRMGPYGRGDPLPWVLEPVAGRIDGGETPETAAYRECLEEAGLTLRGLEHINSHYCSPGSVTEFFHCFVGLCDLPEATTGLGGLDSEHEDIKTHVLSFDAAMALCDSGEVNVGPLVLMLYWLQRERPRLRAAG